jgi:membrane glycosyltransferase
MRHGMRSFTLGSAWWQGDCGPFWGHNALIRIKPFHRHCSMPTIERAGPLSGYVMSHDQVEAVLMRRAGYEVRVLAEEDESFEENPPSLPDFIKREARWCFGNMQYFWLLGTPGLRPVSRIQLLLAILMYLSAPAWMLFVSLGAALAGTTTIFQDVDPVYGLGLFAIIMIFNLMPKIMGVGQTLIDSRESARYGGRIRVVVGGVLELLMSILIAPCVALAMTLCCISLLFGHKMTWDAQQRSRDRLAWGEAARALWPQTLAGLVMGGYLAIQAPYILIFGAPVILSLGLAIPFAVGTTWPTLSAWTRRLGLFDIPEERVSDEDMVDGRIAEVRAA